MAKEAKKMAPATEETKPKTLEMYIKVKELKPKQKFLNLVTGEEDQLEVKSNAYSLVPFDPKIHGDDKSEYYKTAFDFAGKLVQPIDQQCDAFLNFASSESYQEGKKLAFSTGDYLTQEVKSNIGDILLKKTAFADVKKSDAVERWLKGYQAKSPLAMTVLKQAQEMVVDGDIDF